MTSVPALRPNPVLEWIVCLYLSSGCGSFSRCLWPRLQRLCSELNLRARCRSSKCLDKCRTHHHNIPGGLRGRRRGFWYLSSDLVRREVLRNAEPIYFQTDRMALKLHNPPRLGKFFQQTIFSTPSRKYLHSNRLFAILRNRHKSTPNS